MRHQSSLTLILVLATLGAAACGGGAAPPQASIATTLAAGTAAVRQGNYSAAEQLFMQVIKRDPRQMLGYYDLGLAYQDQGEDSQALRAYAKAQALDESFVPVLYNRAVLYASRDPQLAMYLYRRAISLQHDSPTAYLNLGLLEAAQASALGQRGRKLRHQAQALLAEAVRLDPSLVSRVPVALRAGLPGAGQASSSPSS